MVAIVINADSTTTPCLTAYLIEKTGMSTLNIPQGIGKVPLKPTGAFYVKVLTSLLKDVYIHLGVKVDYGHVVEEKKFLSYHVSFSSVSNIRCSSYAGSKKLEEEMRELVTPTLEGATKMSAPFKAVTGRGAARQAPSRILEPTKASAASRRPFIPYVKKESRWGSRYVLRKPSEYTAFSAVRAVPAAVTEEKQAAVEEKAAAVEAVTAPVEEKPVAATEEKPIVEEKPTVEAAPAAMVEAVPAATMEEKPAATTEAVSAATTETVPTATEEKPAATVEAAPATAMEAVPASVKENPIAAEEKSATATEEVLTPGNGEGVAPVEPTPEESCRMTPKESISTSPEHAVSLPAKREEEKKLQSEGDVAARGETIQAPQPETVFVTERRGSDVEQTTSEDNLDREFLALCGKEASLPAREEKAEKDEKDDVDDCFVSLDQASSTAFQSQIQDTMDNYLYSLRREAGMGEVDEEYAREMLLAREETYVPPSVRE